MLMRLFIIIILVFPPIISIIHQAIQRYFHLVVSISLFFLIIRVPLCEPAPIAGALTAVVIGNDSWLYINKMPSKTKPVNVKIIQLESFLKIVVWGVHLV
jgi:hypothetical protein